MPSICAQRTSVLYTFSPSGLSSTMSSVDRVSFTLQQQAQPQHYQRSHSITKNSDGRTARTRHSSIAISVAPTRPPGIGFSLRHNKVRSCGSVVLDIAEMYLDTRSRVTKRVVRIAVRNHALFYGAASIHTLSGENLDFVQHKLNRQSETNWV